MGVHDNTLRRWADQGLIPSRRTAGGHRRFLPEALALDEPTAAGPKGRRLTAAPWQPGQLDATQRELLARLGRRLAQLVDACLSEAPPEAWSAEARQIGRAYALRARAIGLPLSDAVAAFVHFRARMLQGLGLNPLKADALAGYEAVVGAVLIGLAQGYESCLPDAERGPGGPLAANDGDTTGKS